jgi:predicted ATP-dependent protease
MAQLIETARREIPRAFESDDYERRRRDVAQKLAPERAALLDALRAFARARDFVLETTETGFTSYPQIRGEPVSQEAFARLPEAERAGIDRRAAEIETEGANTLRRIRQIDRQEAERLAELRREVARFVAGPLFDELRRAHADHAEIRAYLEAVEEDIPAHIHDFIPEEEEDEDGEESEVHRSRLDEEEADERLARYRVNVVVDNADRKGAPVVFEHNPTKPNLLGHIDHRIAFGAPVSDFSQIKAGAIHRANGGFLVLRAIDVLADASSWRALERTLRARRIEVESPIDVESPMPIPTLRPQPIPLDAKVVLIGTPELYQILHELDPDFASLFKVKVDFVADVDWTAGMVQSYAALVSRIVRDRHLSHFDQSGVACIIEHGARLQEHQGKLSTRIGEIADLATEASFWAQAAGREAVARQDVERAIQKRRYRASALEERVRESIVEGHLRIDVQNRRVGQVNGVSVVDLGDHVFGRPQRITATVGPGRGTVRSIEREIEMSGPIHAKGVLTLAGYLASTYPEEAPLALAATVTFEQSYDEIEGDSASAAELIALLSALAGAPIDQGIAVIGSVDQWGQLQAVGGVTHKIEGFFAVCKAVGMTGRQGVVIPAANRRSLMLDDEVIDAVAAGRFHVWAGPTVDDALPLLLGLPAGSVHAAAAARLRRFAEQRRRSRGIRTRVR